MARLPHDNTYGESALRLRLLYEKIWDAADALGVGDDDARKVNPNNCLAAIGAAEGALRIMEWCRVEGADVLARGLGLAPPHGLAQLSSDLLRATKHYMLLGYQFQVEALFSNLLRALNQKVPGNFGQIITQTLELLQLDDVPERRKRLYIPAYMRNSLHNNGVHTSRTGIDTIVLVGELEFRFEHGKRVSCGHWEHVCVAVSTSFDEVLDVLRTEQVRKLDFVPELYTQLLAQDAS